MNFIRGLLVAALIAIAPAGLSQPPLLPSDLAGAGVAELRAIEPLVWTAPWTARERLSALAPMAGDLEAARQLLLAQSMMYIFPDGEFPAAIDAGLAALSSTSAPLLRHHLATLDGVRIAREGDFDQAAARLADAAARAREDGLTATALFATAERAYAQTQGGSYEQALLTLQGAAQEALIAHDPFFKAQTDEIYGVIYTYIDEFDQAVTYTKRALKGYEKLGYPIYLAEAVFGLATAHRYSGNGSAAIDAFERYRDIMAARSDKAGHFSALYGLGMTQAEMGNCTAALPLIAEALAADGPPDYDAELLKRAAVCEARAGNGDAARSALARARALIAQAPTLEGTRWAIELDKVDSEVNAALGDFEAAYRALLTYHEAQLALLRENASEQRQSSRAALENARQALQIDLLEEQARVRSLEAEQQRGELRNERIGLLLLVSGFALLVAFVLWRLRELRRYRELSISDDLTCVANRRFIFAQLKTLLDGLRPGRGFVSLILIDLDDFKNVNDRYGHPAGDRVLQKTAQAISGILRPGDEVARVGGEEFMLVLPRTGLQDATGVALRARETIEGLSVPVDGDEPIQVTASIGVAATTATRRCVDSLYTAADEALYRAKESGKNRVELASEA